MFTGSLLFNAWARLLRAFLITFALSFTTGIIFIQLLDIAPEAILEVSTKRVSYVFPVLQAGAEYGIDKGLFLFIWNTLGACITISFLYTSTLFNPVNMSHFPQTLRKIFCGRKRMKLLCFLPGCKMIEEESLRRLYVWLMVPWLGLVLLGMECGLTVSTVSTISGSYLVGVLSILPHGIIEIPAFAFAGAIPFGGHLFVKGEVRVGRNDDIFSNLEDYRDSLPLGKCLLIITACLFAAGIVEAHVTQTVLERLMATSG